MSTFKARSASPILDSDSDPNLSDTWEGRTLRAITHYGRDGVVISVQGELDAANAAQLADYVLRCSSQGRWLVLDLHDLEFMGTAGFSVLQSINARCLDDASHWSMVPGVAVSRLLRVCDPDRALPTIDSVAAALDVLRYRKIG